MVSRVTVFCAPAGVGKTTQFAKTIATARLWRRVEVYVPTLKLAQEWKNAIHWHDPRMRVQIIAGRHQLDKGGKPLCRRHVAAALITSAGQSVYSRLCRSNEGMCNHFDICPYIHQFQFSEVYIYTHAYLPLDRGMLDKELPGLVVIDEAFVSVMLQRVTLPITLLRHPALPETAKTLCAAIETSLLCGSNLYPTIAAARKRGGGLVATIDALRSVAPRPQPNQSDQQVAQLVSSTPNFEPVAVMLEHLGRAFAHKQTIQSLDFDPTSGMITVHHRRELTRFTHRSKLRMPPDIFLLDATASRPITEHIFPEQEFVEFQAKRKAYVVQCRSSKCSTRSLDPSTRTTAQGVAEATERLAELQQLIDELSRNGRRLLVVGPAAITGNVNTDTPSLVRVAPHCALAHYSALRGVDEWKDFDAILVIGRNEPPVTAFEDMAKAFYYDHHEPLHLPGKWSTEPRGYRLAVGYEGVDVDVHPDHRVQAFVEQRRESEALQAVDRLRLIHCKEQKLVVLLSNIPLNIDVDVLMTWDELIYGSRLEQAWRGTDVVMPLAPDWLASNFPQLWPTAAAAKKDVQRGVKKGQITNRFSIGKTSPFTFDYRKAGQRRASQCLSMVSDPIVVATALSGLLGHPVMVINPLRTTPFD